MNKTIIALVLVASLIGGVIGDYVGGLVSGEYANQRTGGNGSRFPNGISADSTSPSDGEVRATTLTITGASTQAAITLSGLLTLNAGQLRSNTLSTSTPASMTLKLSDVQGYDTILVAATEAAAAKAFTFFASSTAGTTWLPTAGDTQETCFVNSTTTSAVNLTFTAGTGIILQTATSTAGGIGAPTIAPNNIGCFKFVRHTNTDITAAFTTYKDAD